jgi:hypothetical protein
VKLAILDLISNSHFRTIAATAFGFAMCNGLHVERQITDLRVGGSDFRITAVSSATAAPPS